MMAQEKIVHLMALCAVLSFFYISQSLERHSLTAAPRLSSCLILLLSGCTCYALSFFTRLLPGADARFSRQAGRGIDGGLIRHGPEQDPPLGHRGPMPQRPRRLALPAVAICIALRLEVFHRVNYQQQCATPGVESYLCMLIFAYEVFATRRKWGFPPAEDPDDPWRTSLDDLREWFSGPRVVLCMALASASMLTAGTYLAVSQVHRSTYFCFGLVDSRRTTLVLQVVGLVLDAGIVVMLWRMLAWARTAKLRLRTLGTVLVLSAWAACLVWVGDRFFQGARTLHPGFGFLYGFDIVVDSIAFAALMISASFWVCESSPLVPACIMTFLVGTITAGGNAFRYGDWLHLSRAPALVPLWLTALGAVWFIYCQDIRAIVFVRRIILALLLAVLLITATIFVSVKKPQTFEKRHPINDLIYKAHVKHDQWLRHATESTNLKVAVNVYKERHKGRDPPPGFGDWYSFAKGTLILDQFDQLDRDLRPFWHLSPKVLQQRASLMGDLPGVQMITIKDGEASLIPPKGGQDAKPLEDLVAMINRFANSLPDMKLPINLSPTPRILPSWEEANRDHVRLSQAGDLLTRRSEESLNGTDAVSSDGGDDGPVAASRPGWRYTSPAEYRQMQVEACPPGSRMRTNPHWSISEFCSSCVRPHSRGQLMTDWVKSLQYCSQPDLKYLHGMSLTNPQAPPIRELYPLFGPSKTEAFSDIMVPFPGQEYEPDVRREFNRRYDTLFWRGGVGEHIISHQALHGSHKLRLLHLVNQPDAEDEVTMVLPLKGKPDEFGYERVSALEANTVLPFSIGINNYSACLGTNCELVKQAYGSRDDNQEPLEYRYVLLLDEDDGPPPGLMRTLTSLSVPFVSSVFQTWYTERLMPWMHFVPIDPRFQALHTTFAYFTGTAHRGKLNGRETDMEARRNDAAWIGQQGSRWAEKALGERDMEVYLYRLLLEWGRLLDDKRESIGFRIDEKGEQHSDEWTKKTQGGMS